MDLGQYDKPHIPEKCRNGLAVANEGKPLAALQGDTSEMLQRLRGGESVNQISASLGISQTALYDWILRHCPEEFMAISAARSLSRIEKAEQDLDAAQDQVDIGKARESARLAQWNLERANRKLYGDNKTESGGVNIQVVIDRGEASVNVIDQEPA